MDLDEQLSALPDHLRPVYRELMEGPPIVMYLRPVQVLGIVAELQMALTHPKNSGVCALCAHEFITAVRAAVGPAVAAFIDRGWGLLDERTRDALSSQEIAGQMRLLALNFPRRQRVELTGPSEPPFGSTWD